MCESRSFLRGGPTLTAFFYLMRGETIQIPLNVGHHRTASETPLEMELRWRDNDGPIFNASLEAL